MATNTAATQTTVRVFYLKVYQDASRVMTDEHFQWTAQLTHGMRILTEAEFKSNYALMWASDTNMIHELQGRTEESMCNFLFEVFNSYELNPLSSGFGPEGQAIVRESLTAHTSMSNGDIVVVGSKPYIVANEGFEALSFEVEDRKTEEAV